MSLLTQKELEQELDSFWSQLLTDIEDGVFQLSSSNDRKNKSEKIVTRKANENGFRVKVYDAKGKSRRKDPDGLFYGFKEISGGLMLIYNETKAKQSITSSEAHRIRITLREQLELRRRLGGDLITFTLQFPEFKYEIYNHFICFLSGNQKLTQVLLDELPDSTSDFEIDTLIANGSLIISEVLTGDVITLMKRRRGQNRLRELSLSNYERRCALCDVTDENLLIASHIARWADIPDARGKLSNVICLCSFHDALFEKGYWSLSNNLTVMLNPDKLNAGLTIDMLLDKAVFRLPLSHPPNSEYLKHHHNFHDFE